MKKFKIKLFAIACIALTSLVTLTTSCSKDDDNKEVVVSNAYVYGDNKFDIKWAGYHYAEDQGYVFAIAPKVPADASHLYDEDNYFIIDLPLEQLGVLSNLNDNLDGDSWGFYSAFKFNGTYFDITDQQSENDSDDVTGTNNWVKVTKNSATNNYTFDFEITVGGKLLKGQYTGTFVKYTDYIDGYY